ncbi:hypothetical protein HK405_011949, partial [Cladochytrium tenue]
EGFSYPFLCYRDTDCYVDAAYVPADATSTPADVWQYFWGGEQINVPAGHLRGILLWVPSDA